MTEEGPTIDVRTVPGPVTIELPEAPSTGYEWQLADAPPGVRVVGSEFAPPGESGRVGGSGVRAFRLEVDSPGRHELQFLLRRPWEEHALERRRATLIVGDPGV